MKPLLDEAYQRTEPVIPEASLKEQLIADILLLSAKTQYRTGRCVFAEFHGHVNNLSISIRESVDDFHNELTSSIIHLQPYAFYDAKQKETFEQEIIEELKETKRCLETFIEHGDIDAEGALQIKARIG